MGLKSKEREWQGLIAVQMAMTFKQMACHPDYAIVLVACEHDALIDPRLEMYNVWTSHYSHMCASIHKNK